MKQLFAFMLVAVITAGCAAGAATSATAGYALKAQSADSLTAEGEAKLVERVKGEMKQTPALPAPTTAQ